VSGPTGNGQTKKAAILDAKNEQIKFLNGYYELELANKELIKTINQACNNALDHGYYELELANKELIKTINQACNNALDHGYYELELANKELIKTINQACNNALDHSIKAVNKWKSQSKPTEMDTEK
jgi:hypothetical protein